MLRGIGASITVVIVAALFLAGSGTGNAGVQAQQPAGSRHFAETGHTLKGRFLQYWEANGGLAQQGYPISEEMQEVSQSDGKTYTVQYFERAIFELHPENRPPYDVLLSLLGVFEYNKQYPRGAPNQRPNTDPGTIIFPETGKRLGGSFLEYWRTHGGLAQQGFPISDEFSERSPLNGKVYTVQYFERAVFEWHPENKGTPYEVLLSQLGTFRFRDKYIYPVATVPNPFGRGFRIVGSESYLVWAGEGDVFGYDLEAGKFVAISKDEPGDQSQPYVSGSIAVWLTEPDPNHRGSTDVVGKDLATGREYEIETGPAASRDPVIAGKTVAWIEFDGAGSRIMMMDLDAGSPIRIMSMPPDQHTTIADLQISDEYVAWNEPASYDPRRGDPPRTSRIKTYSRRTGQIKIIAEYGGVFPGRAPDVTVALDGYRVVLTGPQPYVFDLYTGQSTTLKWDRFEYWRSDLMRDPIFKGDVIVWWVFSYAVSGKEGFDTWGLNLKEGGKPGLLALGYSNVAIAGDKLAWLVPEGIVIMPLSNAFATAPEREKELVRAASATPTP